MSLEHRIVEWAQQRPPWQRMVLKRIAEGSPLSSDEVSALVNSLIAATEPRTDSFELADLAVSRADDPPVRLLSIVELEHVNALQLDESLTFESSIRSCRCLAIDSFCLRDFADARQTFAGPPQTKVDSGNNPFAKSV